MKTWLKGGLIVLGLDILILLVTFVMSQSRSLDPDGAYGFLMIFTQMPFLMIIEPLTNETLQLGILVVLSLAGYFILGAIIGLIISKIKLKQQLKK